MKRSVNLRSRRDNGQRKQPIAISAAIAILALTTLLCAAFVAVPLWTALVQGWQVEAIPNELDESRHPAKGANAPIRLHAPGQKTD
jgi:hypothetical protein